MVGSVSISLLGGQFYLHAPIGALAFFESETDSLFKSVLRRLQVVLKSKVTQSQKVAVVHTYVCMKDIFIRTNRRTEGLIEVDKAEDYASKEVLVK